MKYLSRNKMKMDVKERMSSQHPCFDNYFKPVFKLFLSTNIFDYFHYLSSKLNIVFSCFRKIHDMAAENNKNVDKCQRIDVFKSNNLIVFVDNIRFYFLLDNFFKNTLFHSFSSFKLKVLADSKRGEK